MYPRNGPGGPYDRPYPPHLRRGEPPPHPPASAGDYGARPDRYDDYRRPTGPADPGSRDYVRPLPPPRPAYPHGHPYPDEAARGAPRPASYPHRDEARMGRPEEARLRHPYGSVERASQPEFDRRALPEPERRPMAGLDRRPMPEAERRPMAGLDRRPMPEAERRPYGGSDHRPMVDPHRRPFPETERRPLHEPDRPSLNELDRRRAYPGLERPELDHDRRLMPEADRRPYTDPDRRPVPEADRRPYVDPDRRPVHEADRRPYADPDRRPVPEADRRPYAELDRRPYPHPEQRPLQDARFDARSSYDTSRLGIRHDPALGKYPVQELGRERAVGSDSLTSTYPGRPDPQTLHRNPFQAGYNSTDLSQTSTPSQLSEKVANLLSTGLLKNIDLATIEALKLSTSSLASKREAQFPGQSSGLSEKAGIPQYPPSRSTHQTASSLFDQSNRHFSSQALGGNSVPRNGISSEELLSRKTKTSAPSAGNVSKSDYRSPVFMSQGEAWPETPQPTFPIMAPAKDVEDIRSPSPDERNLNEDKYDTYVYLGMEEAPEEFGAVTKILGSENENLDYVRQSTGAIVELRGLGTRLTPNKPLHIYVGHSSYDEMKAAEKLAHSLVKIVKEEYSEWKASQQPRKTDIKATERYKDGASLEARNGPIKIRVPLPKQREDSPPEYNPTPIAYRKETPPPMKDGVYGRGGKADPVSPEDAIRMGKDAMPIGLLPEDDLRLILHQKKREQELEKLVSKEAMVALASKTKISIEGNKRIVKEEHSSQKGSLREDMFSPRDSTPRTDRSRSVSRDRVRRRSRSVDRAGRNRSRSPVHASRNRSRSRSRSRSPHHKSSKSRRRSRSRERRERSPVHKKSSHSTKEYTKDRSSKRRPRSPDRHRSPSKERHTSSKSKHKDRKAKRSRSRSRSKDRKAEQKSEQRKHKKDELKKENRESDESKSDGRKDSSLRDSRERSVNSESRGKYSDERNGSRSPFESSKRADERVTSPPKPSHIDDIYGDFDIRDLQHSTGKPIWEAENENTPEATDIEIPGLGNPMDYAEKPPPEVQYDEITQPNVDNIPSESLYTNLSEPVNIVQEEVPNLRHLRERKFAVKRLLQNYLAGSLSGISEEDDLFTEMDEQAVPSIGLNGDELEDALRSRKWLDMQHICISGEAPEVPGASNIWVLGDIQVYLAAQATYRYHLGQNMGLNNARVHWIGVPGLLLGHLERTVKGYLTKLPTPDCLIIHVGTEDITNDSQPDYLKRVITDGLLDLRVILPNTRIFWSEVLEQMAADPSADVKVAMLRSYANEIAWDVTSNEMHGASIIEHESFINLTNEEYYREPGIYVNDRGAFLIMKNIRLAVDFYLEEVRVRQMRHR